MLVYSIDTQSTVITYIHRMPTPAPFLYVHVEKAGKNHLNEEITPFLPTRIGEQYCKTISNLGHAALLGRCELPL